MSEFFEDHKEKKGICSCWSLMLFFLALLILGFLLSWYLVSQIKEPVKKTISEGLTAPSVPLSEQISKVLGEKGKKEGEISISEKELTQLVSGRRGAFEVQQVLIFPEKLVFQGQLAAPLKSQAEFDVKPILKEGKIRFEPTGARLGNLNVPSAFVKIFLKGVSQSLELVVPEIGPLEVEEMRLERGQMVLKGKIVGR